MKKGVLYSLMASVSMVSAAAYADPVADANSSALTTKGYVDAGLQFVYDVANGTENGTVKNMQTALSDGSGNLINVNNLQNTVGTAGSQGNPGTGLVGSMESLQDAIGTAGNGNTPGTGLTGAVESLQDTLGDSSDGLVKDVSDLQDKIGSASMGTNATTVTGAISELNTAIETLEAASQEYVGGTGIDISQNAQGKNEVSLDLGQNVQNNTNYVFKTNANGTGGTWEAMEVEDSWDPTFLTNP